MHFQSVSWKKYRKHSVMRYQSYSFTVKQRLNVFYLVAQFQLGSYS